MENATSCVRWSASRRSCIRTSTKCGLRWRRLMTLRTVSRSADLPERLSSVLSVIYLVYNEGYSASSGDSATRADLSGEAIRLGRVLLELLPDAEVMGLLALMLLHESRRRARTNAEGDLILLDEQDRLDPANLTRRIFKHGVAILKIVGQRFLNQFVVAVIFALSLKCVLPRVEISHA